MKEELEVILASSPSSGRYWSRFHEPKFLQHEVFLDRLTPRRSGSSRKARSRVGKPHAFSGTFCFSATHPALFVRFLAVKHTYAHILVGY